MASRPSSLQFYEGLDWVLTTPPFWAVIIVLAALAFWLKGWKLSLGSIVGFLLIYGMNQWDNAMNSLALVARRLRDRGGHLRPAGHRRSQVHRRLWHRETVMDFLQTMPAFVYLIPVLLLLGIGPVPGIVATIIFALAPGARFTELGIRSVDRKSSRPARPSVPRPCASCARSRSRWPCPPSWPASTRSSCFRCPWSSSPAWSAPAASVAPSTGH